MSPQRFSALSAVFAVMIVLAAACSTTATTGAGTSDDQEQDRGAAATPLQAAPTDPQPQPDTTKAQSTQADDATPPTTIDIPSIVDRGPLWWGSPFAQQSGPLTSVAYDQPPVSTEGLPTAEDEITVLGVFPDSSTAWVSGPNLSPSVIGCPDPTRPTVVGTLPLDAPAPSNLVLPTDQPANISALDFGPENHVLLSTACDGVSRPTAIAKVTPNGEFTDLVELPADLGAITQVYPIRWIWANTEIADDVEEPWNVPSELVLVVPQRGLVAPGDTTRGPADIYINPSTGEILDVYPSEAVFDQSADRRTVRSDGESLFFNDDVDDEPLSFEGPITTLELQPGFGPEGLRSIVVAGPSGVSVINYAELGEDFDYRANRWMTELTTTPVTDVAWAPSGAALAISDADGTRLRLANGDIVVLSPTDGKLFFSPDGSTLVIDGPNQIEKIRFAEVEPPSDTNEVTPFSKLDSGGLGPIRVGMSLSQVKDVLDTDLDTFSLDEDPLEGMCVSASSPELPGVYMLASSTGDGDAIVQSVVVLDGPWATPSGLRIGSTETDIRDALGLQLAQTPHAYIGTGSYFTFTPLDDADPNSVKFDTNGHEVLAIHAGHMDWIALVEGCL